MVTSSAVVGSSAMRASGRRPARWRSSRAGAFRPTARADTARRRRSGSVTCTCSSSCERPRTRAAPGRIRYARRATPRSGRRSADAESATSADPGRPSPCPRRARDPARAADCPSNSDAVEARASADARVRRQQPHHRQERLALPGAGFADDADALAWPARSSEKPSHGRDLAAGVAKLTPRSRISSTGALSAHAGPAHRAGHRPGN